MAKELFECYDCGEVYEGEDGCPVCGSGEYTDVSCYECCVCGKFVTEDDGEYIEDGHFEDNETHLVCFECLKKIETEYNTWKLNHTEAEQAIIESIAEGSLWTR